MENKADGGSKDFAAANVGINLVIKGEEKIKSFGNTLESITHGSGIEKYLTDVETIIKKISDSAGSFKGFSNALNAKELMNWVNALKGISGQDSLEKLSDTFPEISSALEISKRAFADFGSTVETVSVNAIKELNESMAILKYCGVDVDTVLKNISLGVKSQDLEKTVSELQRLVAEYEDTIKKLESGTTFTKTKQELAELQKEFDSLYIQFENLKETGLNEFDTFLKANDVDSDRLYSWDNGFVKLWNNVRDGAITAKEAIAQFKAEYPDQISVGSGVEIDADMLSGFTSKLEEVLTKVEEIRTRISTMGATMGDLSGEGAASLQPLDTAFQSLTSHIEAGEEVVSRQSTTFGDMAAKSDMFAKAMQSIVDLIKNSPLSDTGADSVASAVQKITEAVFGLSVNTDTSQLRYISELVGNVSKLSGVRINNAAFAALKENLKQLNDVSNTDSLVRISNLRFGWVNDLKTKNAALTALSTNLPIIASANVDNLERIANINWENFGKISFNKNSLESLKELGEVQELASVINMFKELETLIQGINSDKSLVSGIKDATKQGSLNAPVSKSALSTISEYWKYMTELSKTENDIYTNEKGIFESASGKWNELADVLNRVSESYALIYDEIENNTGLLERDAKLKDQYSTSIEAYTNKKTSASSYKEASAAIKEYYNTVTKIRTDLINGIDSGVFYDDDAGVWTAKSTEAAGYAARLNHLNTIIKNLSVSLENGSISSEQYQKALELIDDSVSKMEGSVSRANVKFVEQTNAEEEAEAKVDLYEKLMLAVKEYYSAVTSLKSDQAKGLDMGLAQDDTTNIWTATTSGAQQYADSLNSLYSTMTSATQAFNDGRISEEQYKEITDKITESQSKLAMTIEQVTLKTEANTKANEEAKRVSDIYNEAKNAVSQYYDEVTKVSTQQAKGVSTGLTQDGTTGVWSATISEAESSADRLNTLRGTMENAFSDMFAELQNGTISTEKYLSAVYTLVNAESKLAMSIEQTSIKTAQSNQTKEEAKANKAVYDEYSNAISEYIRKLTELSKAKANDQNVAINYDKNAGIWVADSSGTDTTAEVMNRLQTKVLSLSDAFNTGKITAEQFAELMTRLKNENESLIMSVEQTISRSSRTKAFEESKKAVEEYIQALTQLRVAEAKGHIEGVEQDPDSLVWSASGGSELDGTIARLNELQSRLASIQILFKNGVLSENQYISAMVMLADGMSKVESTVEITTEKLRLQNERLKANSTTAENAMTKITEVETKLNGLYASGATSQKKSSRDAYEALSKQLKTTKSTYEEYKNGTKTEEALRLETSILNEQFKQTKAILEANGDASGALHTKFQKLISSFSMWFSSYRLVMKFVQSVKQAVNNSMELETAFTQLKIVTGATDSEMESFSATTFDLAKKLGQSATEVSKSIETFSRLGYGLSDASTLSEYATILSNVAAVEEDEATAGLTSIIKGYGMEVSEAEHVSDVLIEVGQKYAVSAGELMEAFERSGAALSATNTSFEKSAALIAAANAAVQNSSTVGTALKTISARIRGSKSDLEELGEDTDELANGFSKYAEELKALTGVNILVDGSTTEFKDLYDIMQDISVVWGSLTDTQQARTAEILGGTRQLQVVSSIINNWKDAAGAYQDAANAAGVASKANSLYMDTAQARIEIFKASFEELSSYAIDSGFLGDMVDVGTSLMSAATSVAKLTESIGGMKTTLVALAGIFATFKSLAIVNFLSKAKSGILSIMRHLSGSGGVLPTLSSIKLVMNAFRTLFVNAKSTGVSSITAIWRALSGLKGEAFAANLVVGSLMAALTAGVAIYSKVKQRQEEVAVKTVEDTQKAKEEYDAIYEKLNAFSTFEKYAGQTSLTASQESELSSALTIVAEAIGVKEDAIKSAIGVSDTYIEKVKEMTKAELERAAIEAKAERAGAKETLTGSGRKIDSNSGVSVLKSVWDSVLESLGHLDDPEYAVDTSEEISSIVNALESKLGDLWDKYGNESAIGLGGVLSIGSGMAYDLKPGQLGDANDYLEYYETLVKARDIIIEAGMEDTDTYARIVSNIDTLSESAEAYKTSVMDVISTTYASEHGGLPKSLDEFKSFQESAVSSIVTELGVNESMAADIVNAYLESQSVYSDFISQINQESIEGNNSAEDIELRVRDRLKSDILLKKADIDELREKLKKVNEEYNAFVNGNLDYNKRPAYKTSDEMHNAGWSDFEDGDLATTYSSGYLLEGLNFDYVIELTPIMEDGTVLSPQALNDYFDRIRDQLNEGFSDQDILDLDTENLLINIWENEKIEDPYAFFDSDAYWEWQDSLQEIKDKHLEITDEISEEEDVLKDLESRYKKILEVIKDVEAKDVEAAEKAAEKTSTISSLDKLSDGFEKLTAIYGDVSDGDTFDFSSLIDEDFASEFENCGEAYSNFISTVAESPSDINACQNAFNGLAAAYIEQSGVLSTVTEGNKELVTAMLQQMGVSNAAAIVEKKLGEDRAYNAFVTEELKNKTYEEIVGLYNAANAAGTAKAYYARLAVEKAQVNSTSINTSSDVAQLLTLANAAGATVASLAKVQLALRYMAKSEELMEKGGLEAVLGSTYYLFSKALLTEPLEYTKLTGADVQVSPTTSPTTKNDTDSKTTTQTKLEKDIEAEKHKLEMGKITEDQYYTWLTNRTKQAHDEQEITDREYWKYQEELHDYYQEKKKKKLEEDIKAQEHEVDMGRKSESEYYKWLNAEVKKAYKDKVITEEEYDDYQREIEKGRREIAKDAFEEEIKEHEHNVDMEKETEAEYYKWLEGKVKKAYKNKLITEEEYEDYLREIEKGKKEAAKDTLDKEIKAQEHKVAMGEKSESAYYRWLEKRVEKAYKDGIISAEEYAEYQEELLEGFRNVFDDTISDIKHEISMRQEFEGEANTIIKLATNARKKIEKQIKKARAEGLDDNDEYIQKLQDEWIELGNIIEETTDNITDNAKSAFDSLIDYIEDMIKQDYENQKEALEKKLDALEEYYDKQKEMLEDANDEEKYLEEQEEKRKAVSDIEAELARLEFDNSAWAEKKKAELKQDLIDAQKELDDFEKDKALELALDTLDKSYEAEKKAYDEQIKAIEDALNNPELIFNAALKQIQGNTDKLLSSMVLYNRKYGTGNDEDVYEIWDSAKDAFDEYTNANGSNYKKENVATGIKGDLNNDGVVNSKDVKIAEGILAKGVKGIDNIDATHDQKDNMDMNDNGWFTQADVNQIKKIADTNALIKKYDFNGDGVVNDKDAEILLQLALDIAEGRKTATEKRKAKYDLNGDKKIDVNDAQKFYKLLKKWGGGLGTGWNGAAVSGYASGTSNATSGLHEINEEGDEAIFQSKNGSTYKIFSGGEKVLNAKATDFIYKFANGGVNLLKNMIESAVNGSVASKIIQANVANTITMGDIVINGNADEKTVSQIRREQKAQLDTMLKQINLLAT